MPGGWDWVGQLIGRLVLKITIMYALTKMGLKMVIFRIHLLQCLRHRSLLVRVWYNYSVEAICLISQEPRSWLAG
jgi:hypothetical protein